MVQKICKICVLDTRVRQVDSMYSRISITFDLESKCQRVRENERLQKPYYQEQNTIGAIYVALLRNIVCNAISID